MKRLLTLCSLLLLSAFGAVTPADQASSDPSVPTIRWVEFKHSVNPVSIKRITRSIELAETEGNALVIIRLDTPGGLVLSLHEAVQSILNSPVPVVVWVAPAGAHAASAGFFLLVAADVAVMAPGTRTGAASTVFGNGGAGENREDDVLLKKMNEDGAALLRSIAERRGRNKEACEAAVFAAKAFEETVALEKGLIDFIAADREQLLEALDGREVVRFDGSRLRLSTAGAQIVESNLDAKQLFFEFLARPEIAYLLFVVGGFLVYMEFQNPGLIFPGVLGALCLALFAVSATNLPISVVGILLIALAVGLFVLELKFVSHGLLTLAGIASLIAGSLLLVDGPIPALRVPPSIVIPMSIVVGLSVVWSMRLALQAQRVPVTTGNEGLLQEEGVVSRRLAPEGKVFVRGESWNARTEGEPIAEGERVRIVRVDDLQVTVERVESGGGDL